MERTKFYSGMIPSVEDLEFEQESKENAVKERISDFFTDGVLTGLQVTIETGGVYVQPGIAYVSGERIVVTETSLVSDTVHDGFVFVKFIQIESEPESHFITGEAHNTRVTDSFEKGIAPADTLGENELLLAQISSGYAIDRRTFIELKLSQPDSIEPPANLIVSTGFETEVSYSQNMVS